MYRVPKKRSGKRKRLLYSLSLRRNAGDGKTAFLQQVEAVFASHGTSIESLPSNNGSRWEFQGVRYETNYDGSQDEGDRSNDAVLAAFLEPFAGNTVKGLAGAEARLIAINEGRLLDFLAHGEYADRFPGLRAFVLGSHENTAQLSRALLINLNTRAVTAGGADSLMERQLLAMLRPELWRPCNSCSYATQCPIKHNVDSLSERSSGPAVRERLRRLFELIHLRRQSHITMRDLRSALSFVLLRDHSCHDISTLLSRRDEAVTEDLAYLYYPNAFADQEVNATASVSSTVTQVADERAVDRLVRRLREIDVGIVNSPLLDRRLDHDPTTAVPWMTFEGRSGQGWQILRALTQNAPHPRDDLPLQLLMSRRSAIQSMWRRWAYFERRDDGWEQMLPFRSAALLERIVTPKDPQDEQKASSELLNEVLDAISLL